MYDSIQLFSSFYWCYYYYFFIRLIVRSLNHVFLVLASWNCLCVCGKKKSKKFVLGPNTSGLWQYNRYNLNWNVWIACLNGCNRRHNWFERDEKEKNAHTIQTIHHSNQLKTIFRAFIVWISSIRLSLVEQSKYLNFR